MKKISSGLFFVGLFMMGKAQDSTGKEMDRTVFSIMVRPYSAKDSNVVRRIEYEPGYKDALSVINSALIDMGYNRSMDPATYLDNIKERNELTHDSTIGATTVTQLLQKAPVDVFIDTEITWIDPSGNPRNRQVRLLLRAVDKYTGAIYAVNGSIHSSQREFPDLSTAVDLCLKGDGKAEFKKFLDQLDNSYARVIKEGRMVNMRFELSLTSQLKLSERFKGERISDRMETCVRSHAFKGRYKVLSAGDDFMEFLVWVPVIDEAGVSVTPYNFMGKKVDDDFNRVGLQSKCTVKGTWLNFILLSRG